MSKLEPSSIRVKNGLTFFKAPNTIGFEKKIIANLNSKENGR